MSGRYCSWVIRSSIWVVGSSWTSWASWCSPEGNVEGVSDMVRVLVLHSQGRVIIVSRYKGSRDDLHGHCQGLCRHNAATVCITSNGSVLLGSPFSVWASWAAYFNNCWYAPDLYVNGGY